MGIDKKQLLQYVIGPALHRIGLDTPESMALVLGTAMVESDCGRYIHQINGPALGIYQMEPATYDDIFANFLIYKKQMMDVMAPFGRPRIEKMIYDLEFASQMCRIHYFRMPGKIPKNADEMAQYYKNYYNTPKGKAVTSECIPKFQEAINCVG